MLKYFYTSYNPTAIHLTKHLIMVIYLIVTNIATLPKSSAKTTE